MATKYQALVSFKEERTFVSGAMPKIRAFVGHERYNELFRERLSLLPSITDSAPLWSQ